MKANQSGNVNTKRHPLSKDYGETPPMLEKEAQDDMSDAKSGGEEDEEKKKKKRKKKRNAGDKPPTLLPMLMPPVLGGSTTTEENKDDKSGITTLIKAGPTDMADQPASPEKAAESTGSPKKTASPTGSPKKSAAPRKTKVEKYLMPPQPKVKVEEGKPSASGNGKAGFQDAFLQQMMDKHNNSPAVEENIKKRSLEKADPSQSFLSQVGLDPGPASQMEGGMGNKTNELSPFAKYVFQQTSVKRELTGGEGPPNKFLNVGGQTIPVHVMTGASITGPVKSESSSATSQPPGAINTINQQMTNLESGYGSIFESQQQEEPDEPMKTEPSDEQGQSSLDRHPVVISTPGASSVAPTTATSPMTSIDGTLSTTNTVSYLATNTPSTARTASELLQPSGALKSPTHQQQIFVDQDGKPVKILQTLVQQPGGGIRAPTILVHTGPDGQQRFIKTPPGVTARTQLRSPTGQPPTRVIQLSTVEKPAQATSPHFVLQGVRQVQPPVRPPDHQTYAMPPKKGGFDMPLNLSMTSPTDQSMMPASQLEGTTTTSEAVSVQPGSTVTYPASGKTVKELVRMQKDIKEKQALFMGQKNVKEKQPLSVTQSQLLALIKQSQGNKEQVIIAKHPQGTPAGHIVQQSGGLHLLANTVANRVSSQTNPLISPATILATESGPSTPISVQRHKPGALTTTSTLILQQPATNMTQSTVRKLLPSSTTAPTLPSTKPVLMNIAGLPAQGFVGSTQGQVMINNQRVQITSPSSLSAALKSPALTAGSVLKQSTADQILHRHLQTLSGSGQVAQTLTTTSSSNLPKNLLGVAGTSLRLQPLLTTIPETSRQQVQQLTLSATACAPVTAVISPPHTLLATPSTAPQTVATIVAPAAAAPAAPLALAAATTMAATAATSPCTTKASAAAALTRPVAVSIAGVTPSVSLVAASSVRSAMPLLATSLLSATPLQLQRQPILVRTMTTIPSTQTLPTESSFSEIIMECPLDNTVELKEEVVETNPAEQTELVDNKLKCTLVPQPKSIVSSAPSVLVTSLLTGTAGKAQSGPKKRRLKKKLIKEEVKVETLAGPIEDVFTSLQTEEDVQTVSMEEEVSEETVTSEEDLYKTPDVSTELTIATDLSSHHTYSGLPSGGQGTSTDLHFSPTSQPKKKKVSHITNVHS